MEYLLTFHLTKDITKRNNYHHNTEGPRSCWRVRSPITQALGWCYVLGLSELSISDCWVQSTLDRLTHAEIAQIGEAPIYETLLKGAEESTHKKKLIARITSWLQLLPLS
jgi:hypothetical protein